MGIKSFIKKVGRAVDPTVDPLNLFLPYAATNAVLAGSGNAPLGLGAGDNPMQGTNKVIAKAQEAWNAQAAANARPDEFDTILREAMLAGWGSPDQVSDLEATFSSKSKSGFGFSKRGLAGPFKTVLG